MKKCAAIFGLASILVLMGGTMNSWAQQCDSTVILITESVDIEACDTELVVPVSMTNDCPVGGFSIEVRVTDPQWLQFDPGDTLTVDTSGCRVTGFGSFDWVIQQPYNNSVTVTAIGPGGAQPFLPPGSGPIFKVRLVRNPVDLDTCQLINFGSCQVSDTTGLNSFSKSYIRGSVCVVDSCPSDMVRGDANRSGGLNGLDVTFLVNYFKGQSSEPFCTACTCYGDANNSDDVNGLDVTYLVAFFKGNADPPVPCD
jgi:hypothetical protein